MAVRAENMKKKKMSLLEWVTYYTATQLEKEYIEVAQTLSMKISFPQVVETILSATVGKVLAKAGVMASSSISLPTATIAVTNPFSNDLTAKKIDSANGLVAKFQTFFEENNDKKKCEEDVILTSLQKCIDESLLQASNLRKEHQALPARYDAILKVCQKIFNEIAQFNLYRDSFKAGFEEGEAATVKAYQDKLLTFLIQQYFIVLVDEEKLTQYKLASAEPKDAKYINGLHLVLKNLILEKIPRIKLKQDIEGIVEYIESFLYNISTREKEFTTSKFTCELLEFTRPLKLKLDHAKQYKNKLNADHENKIANDKSKQAMNNKQSGDSQSNEKKKNDDQLFKKSGKSASADRPERSEKPASLAQGEAAKNGTADSEAAKNRANSEAANSVSAKEEAAKNEAAKKNAAKTLGGSPNINNVKLQPTLVVADSKQKHEVEGAPESNGVSMQTLTQAQNLNNGPGAAVLLNHFTATGNSSSGGMVFSSAATALTPSLALNGNNTTAAAAVLNEQLPGTNLNGQGSEGKSKKKNKKK